MLEKFDAPPTKQRAIMESQIERVVAQIREHVPRDTPLEMVAIGGDVRFAAANLLEAWDPTSLAYLVGRSAERIHAQDAGDERR